MKSVNSLVLEDLIFDYVSSSPPQSLRIFVVFTRSYVLWGPASGAKKFQRKKKSLSSS